MTEFQRNSNGVCPPQEILKQIGDGLRMRRLFLNMTREVAAERSGISASTVKNIENGHGGSIWALVSLCRVLAFRGTVPPLGDTGYSATLCDVDHGYTGKKIMI